MKIRNGFVSNSSSSSFIINAENEFSTVRDVAKYIMIECLRHWTSECDFNAELQTLNKISDPNTPVYFSTGDETYIRKVDDKIVIATTQNVRLEKITDVSLNSSDLSEEFYRKFDHIDEGGYARKYKQINDFDYYYYMFDDFLILEHDIIGKEKYISGCPYCNDKFSRGWELKNGEEICDCQIKKYIRRIKLNNLNENNYNK